MSPAATDCPAPCVVTKRRPAPKAKSAPAPGPGPGAGHAPGGDGADGAGDGCGAVGGAGGAGGAGDGAGGAGAGLHGRGRGCGRGRGRARGRSRGHAVAAGIDSSTPADDALPMPAADGPAYHLAPDGAAPVDIYGDSSDEGRGNDDFVNGNIDDELTSMLKGCDEHLRSLDKSMASAVAAMPVLPTGAVAESPVDPSTLHVWQEDVAGGKVPNMLQNDKTNSSHYNIIIAPAAEHPKLR